MREYIGESDVSTAEAGTNLDVATKETRTKIGSAAVEIGVETEGVVAFLFQNEGAGALDFLVDPLARAREKQEKGKSAKENQQRNQDTDGKKEITSRRESGHEFLEKTWPFTNPYDVREDPLNPVRNMSVQRRRRILGCKRRRREVKIQDRTQERKQSTYEYNSKPQESR